AALAELRDVDRTEDLVRLGEARQQVLEVLRVDELREHANERALRGARRADQQEMLAGQRRDEHQAHRLALAEEVVLERLRELLEPQREIGTRRGDVVHAAASPWR